MIKLLYHNYLLISLLVFTNAYANFYPYDTPPSDYKTHGPPCEVNNLLPIKDQGDIGFCYAFSATSLLEQFNCKIKGSDYCKNKKDVTLSVLHTATYGSMLKKIYEGGTPSQLLANIEREGKFTIAKEGCAPYRALISIYNEEITTPPNQFNYTLEMLLYSVFKTKTGWDTLKKTFIDFRKRYSSRDTEKALEVAKNIKQFHPELNTSIQEIADALCKERSDEEYFVRDILIPDYCLDEAETLPRFVSKSLRANAKFEDTFVDRQELLKHIIKLISINTPSVLSFVSGKSTQTNKIDAHATLISGVKVVCNKNSSDCKTMLKLHNSYGEEWQLIHNEGWVLAEKIINNAFSLPNHTPVLAWVKAENHNSENICAFEKIKTSDFSGKPLTGSFCNPGEYECKNIDSSIKICSLNPLQDGFFCVRVEK